LESDFEIQNFRKQNVLIQYFAEGLILLIA